jgi:hypothetical protein
MKILITILFLISSLVVFPLLGYSAEPQYKAHKIEGVAPGSNYSINYPVINDFDNDGDDDLIIITKEGIIYVLENITNKKVSDS